MSTTKREKKLINKANREAGICTKTQHELCLNAECAVCNERRFAKHRFGRCYSSKNEYNILLITLKTDKMIYLNCPDCGKETYGMVCVITKLGDESTFCKDCDKKRILERNQKKREERLAKNPPKEKICGPKSPLCDKSDCTTCPERKFSNHPNARFYSRKNKIELKTLTMSSHKECIFDCPRCRCEMKLPVYQYISRKDGLCPDCCIIVRMELNRSIPKGKCKPTSTILCNNKKCEYCPPRKFSKHRFASSYSTKNEEDINQVKIHSGLSYYFDCLDCGKEHYLKLSDLTKLTEGTMFCNDCREREIQDRRDEKKRIEMEEEKNKICSDRALILCHRTECTTCEERRFAYHKFAPYYSDKNEEDIWDLIKGSGKYYLFTCDVCNHDSEQSLSNITRQDCTGFCRYCSGERFCGDLECKPCFDRSFGSHEKAQYWSEKNEKKPWEVSKGLFEPRFWFNCTDCGHEFAGRLSHITNPNEQTWCPFCHTEDLCQTECVICFPKSFASHEKVLCWSEKNERKAFQVRIGSNEFILFNCDICHHEFEMQPNKVVDKKRPHWCPYCSITYLCKKEDCDHCFKRSFASMPQSIMWSEKNELKPRQVFKKTNKRFLFDCPDCKSEFMNSPADMYFHKSECTVCTLKTEKRMLKYLTETYSDYTIIRNPRFNWCVNPNSGKVLPFDILIKELNLIIEIDGEQHFKYVEFFKNDVIKNQNRDLYKMRIAKENGFTLIRIVQMDILYDRFDWRTELHEFIKVYDLPSFIFMCKRDEYRPYIERIEDIDSITLDMELINEEIENEEYIEEDE